MSGTAEALAAGLAGAAVGWGYFGSLWWTVRRLPTAAHPAPLLLGNFLLRHLLALGFLFLAAPLGWPCLLAGAVGFGVARMVWVRRLRPDAVRDGAQTTERAW